MKVQFLGHGSFLITLNGTNLLIDPFISGGPGKDIIDINTISADYILLTHGHGDHVADAETIAKRTGATIVSNFEIVTWYENLGIKGHAMNHGGKYKFDFGTIKYVYATHSSSMPDGSYAGNPGGFVIWDDNHSIYVAGDTGLTMDMKLIPMLCPKLDVAIFPIGDNFTMGYEEAILASDFVKCNNVIACHYDSMEVIKIDKQQISKVFNEKAKEIHFLDIGESKEF